MKKFIKSLKFAINGLKYTFQTQRSFKIQLTIFIFIISLSIYLKISLTKIAILFLIASIVLVLEVLNTMVEQLIDFISPKFNIKAGLIKDIMAGAVLLSAIFSVLVGLLILLKPLIIKIKYLVLR